MHEGLARTLGARGRHLALSVPGIDAARGLEVPSEPSASEAGLRPFLTRDMDGNPLEFAGPSRPE